MTATLLTPFLRVYFPILVLRGRPATYVDASSSLARERGGGPLEAIAASLRNARIFDAPIHMTFVDPDPERARALEVELAELAPRGRTRNVVVERVAHGEPAAELDAMLSAFESGARKRGAGLVVVDPLAGGRIPMSILSRVIALRDPAWDVFASIDARRLHHFAFTPELAGEVTAVFGDDRWRTAVEVPSVGGLERLADRYRASLKAHTGARYVWRCTTQRADDAPIHHLFFASHQRAGLEELKRAILKAEDPLELRFWDAERHKHMPVLAFDQRWLERELWRTFGGTSPTMAAIEDHLLEATPILRYKPALHALRRRGVLAGAPKSFDDDPAATLTFAPYPRS